MTAVRRALRSDPQRNELRAFADRAGWRLRVDRIAQREHRPWVMFVDKSGRTVASFADVASALRWFRGTASPKHEWWNT